MQHRDAIVQALLSFIVPFYIVYWSYVVGREIEKSYNLKAPNILLLLAPCILFLVAIIFTVLAFVARGDSAGAIVSILFFLGFIVMIPVSIGLSLYYYYKFGGNVEQLVGPQASRLIVLLLFWFISPIGVYIVQDRLNALILSQSPSQQ